MANPVIEKIRKKISPIEIFRLLEDRPYVFFLDSALTDAKQGRFSFLGCDPFLVFKSKGEAITLERSGGKNETFTANPFAVLKDIFKRYERKALPRVLPFTSGGVGYFSYDMKGFVENLRDSAVDDLGIPDCIMGFYDTAIVYDNLKHKTYIAGGNRLAEFKNILSSGISRRDNLSDVPAARLRSNFSKPGYFKVIKKAKKYIKKGDIYQVNLSQRFEADIDIKPSRLYSRLRTISPAPFAAYLGFGDVAILSSSPERFLFKKGRYIETRPIKGTRPRGVTKGGDQALSRELSSSAKDNAEHIMIVDLERNDLGRICDYGTVKLTRPAAIEKFSNVIHMVSTVSGRLKKDATPIDCLMASFPGGSITGAPKVRAMEIIEELEGVKRSVYTGAVGYISFDGNMDTSVVIRTLIAKGKRVYFSVGGGIVADSDPEAEYVETIDKAAGIMKALGICAPGRKSGKEAVWQR